MDSNKNIQEQIEQRFKKLMERTESDPGLKKEVFGTIAKIEGAAAILDLFTVKMIKTETTLLDEISKSPPGIPDLSGR